MIFAFRLFSGSPRKKVRPRQSPAGAPITGFVDRLKRYNFELSMMSRHASEQTWKRGIPLHSEMVSRIKIYLHFKSDLLSSIIHWTLETIPCPNTFRTSRTSLKKFRMSFSSGTESSSNHALRKGWLQTPPTCVAVSKWT